MQLRVDGYGQTKIDTILRARLMKNNLMHTFICSYGTEVQTWSPFREFGSVTLSHAWIMRQEHVAMIER